MKSLLAAVMVLLTFSLSAPAWGFLEQARERRQLERQLEQVQELLRQQRVSDALPLMTALAEKGHVELQLSLALLYFEGAIPTHQLGQSRGPQGENFPDGRAWAAIARGWLERVVQQPSANTDQLRAAWHAIAVTWCCWPRFSPTVNLTSQEWSAAREAFERAVALGNPQSMLMLAQMHATPKGLPRNDTSALELLTRLAHSSDAEPTLKAKGQQLAQAITERSRSEERQVAEAAAAAARQAELDRAALEARRQQAQERQETERRRAEEAREQQRLAREKEERERPAREAAERAQAQAAQAEQNRRERELARQCDELKAVCPRLVFAGKPVIEDLANRLSVYPGSIRLDRVTLEKDFLGCSCRAVFWTPGGTLACSVRQYSGLTVTATSACSR